MTRPAHATPVFPPSCAQTASIRNGARSLRDASTREDEGHSASRAREPSGLLLSRQIPTQVEDARVPQPHLARTASKFPSLAVRHFSPTTDEISHDLIQRTNPNADGAQMFSTKNVLNVPVTELTRRRRMVERGLRYIAREAVSDAPAKIVAREAEISVREVTHLRTATRNPRLDVWYAVLARRPDLKPYVEQITSGEATSEQIQKLIRFFQQGEGA